jgi:hypothetical protein
VSFQVPGGGHAKDVTAIGHGDVRIPARARLPGHAPPQPLPLHTVSSVASEVAIALTARVPIIGAHASSSVRNRGRIDGIAR